MDPTVYAEAPRQSLRELSRDKKNGRYALFSNRRFDRVVINLEAMIEQWCGPPPLPGDDGHYPCRCDGFYWEIDPETAETTQYLLEFKAGKDSNIQVLYLHRKLYDSLIRMVEHKGTTFDESRKSMVYVVVHSAADESQPPAQQLLRRNHGRPAHPWEIPPKHRGGDKNLGLQKDVTVKDAYYLTPVQFYFFIREFWHSA